MEGLTVRAHSEADRLAAEIKEVALKSGASLVGIVSAEAYDALPKIWVGWTIKEYTKKTTEVMSDAKSIVVIGYHVWDDMLELAIRRGENWAYPGYFPLDYLEQKVANCLERKGHETRAFYSGSCKRLAQLAGLGNYGKNALIINSVFGPWIRLTPVLTTVELTSDRPFEENLCDGCESCIEACPVGALTPYRVDDSKCLVGRHIADKENYEQDEKLRKYEPSFTKNSHLMCIECQKACRYGKEKH
jgi:epoxyqueuosine reductase QueG